MMGISTLLIARDAVRETAEAILGTQ